jgi:hypothetical protein
MGFGKMYTDNTVSYTEILSESTLAFSTVQTGLTLPLASYQKFQELLDFATRN